MNDRIPKAQKGNGSFIVAIYGTPKVIILANMLHIESKVDFISTGNSMFEHLQTKMEIGHIPSLPMKTNIETNIGDLSGIVIYNPDAKKHKKQNIWNDGLIPNLFIIGTDIPQEIIIPPDCKRLFMYMSPSIFVRQKFIRQKLKIPAVHIVAIITKFFKKTEYLSIKYNVPSIVANPSLTYAIDTTIVSCFYITISIIYTYPTHALIAAIIPNRNIRKQNVQRSLAIKNAPQAIVPTKAFTQRRGFLPYLSLNGMTRSILINIPTKQRDPKSPIYDSESQQSSSYSTQL
ncbi:UNKNOWN [Stylonychia lemnae]|uniref:Uncharacterized protein n=1 Tax=Stylonychia lemnae TaxID=5949 RepID=A0A078BB19_STYLE|nr:UNKNOWN [Stylonychia lemnae]|eukprot:CDW90442.1 UNKNOWN [Stylonychia lemnae]